MFDKFLEKRVIERGYREACKLGLSNGKVICQTLALPNSTIHYLPKQETVFQWSTVNYVLAAVWQGQHQQILRVFPYNKFKKNLPQTSQFLKNEDNLIALILSHNPSLFCLSSSLIDLSQQHQISIVAYLVHLVIDDLRVDLYDALKEYVLAGKKPEDHILRMLNQSGLLWLDYNIPDEVKLFFANKEKNK